MKRFTETTKWDDPWYQNLSPPAKLLWSWLLDKCNLVGLIELDFAAASFHIGCKIEEKHLAELESRLQRLHKWKFFIPKFIPFQYGELSVDCRAHKPIFRTIEQLHLTQTSIGYQYPIDRDGDTLGDTLQEQEQEQDKEKEGGSGGKYHADARSVLYILNEASGKHFRETDSNLGFISARLCESGVDLPGVKTMILRQCARWKGTKEAEYLRPETLFNATKFDGYYAAKDQPIHENNGSNHSQRPDRNIGTFNAGTSGQYGAFAKLLRTESLQRSRPDRPADGGDKICSPPEKPPKA